MRAQATSVFPQSECYQVNGILNWHGIAKSWLRRYYPALQSAVNPPLNAESVHKMLPNASQLGSGYEIMSPEQIYQQACTASWWAGTALLFSASSGGFLKGITFNTCNIGSVCTFYNTYRKVSVKTTEAENPFFKVALKCFTFTVFFSRYLKWVWYNSDF